MRIVLVLIMLCGIARADEHKPKELSDRARELHLALTGAMAAAYLTAEFGFNAELSPTECRWCQPTGFDGAMRDALVWRDTAEAGTLSNLTGYILNPVLMPALV